MDFPKHFSLAQDNDDHFLLHDSRDNTQFPVSKRDLHPSTHINVMKMKKYADGGDVEPSVADAIPQLEAQGLSPEAMAQMSAASPEVAIPDQAMIIPPQQEAMVMPDPSMEQVARMPQSVPQASVAAPAPQQGLAIPVHPHGAPTLDSFQALQGAYGKSLQNEAQAEVAKNKQIADIQDFHNQVMKDKMATYEANMKGYQDQYKQMMDDVATEKIDPTQFWHNKSAGNKVGTAIALLLGGIGQGLSRSNTNAAMDVLNSQVDQNIAAQRANLGKKQSLLADNLKIQGNLTDAENATRMQYAAMLQGQLASVAAKANSPMIMERAKQEGLKFQMQAIPMAESLAKTQADRQIKQQILNPRTDMSQVDPAQLVTYVVPEHHQKQVFEEIKGAQNANALTPKIMDAFARGSSRNPITAAQGQRDFEALINTTVADLEGTAREAAFESIHKNMSPSGITATPGENAVKAKTVLNYLASKAAAPTAKGYGIDLSKFKSTSTDPYMRLDGQQKQYADWAKQNPNDPRSQVVLKKLGLQ